MSCFEFTNLVGIYFYFKKPICIVVRQRRQVQLTSSMKYNVGSMLEKEGKGVPVGHDADKTRN